jgi:ankyrin repeat protein
LGLGLLLIVSVGCGEPDRPNVSLYLAVQRGDIEQLQRHVHWDSDLNSLDPDGNRPLHVLAERGNIVAVKQLLRAGVDINAKDRAGRTALHRALLAGRTQLASVLVAQGADFDPSTLLIDVAQNDVPDRDVISWLVARGADPEHTNDQGDTALIIAVKKKDHRLVRHLVTQGADVNTRNRAGRLPLDVALELEQEEIATYLRRYGALESGSAG